MVAPYEADSQLAYICQRSIASAVITEDSDLLVFKCSEVLYKLDIDATFSRIRYKDIFKICGMEGVTPDRFVEMCILSGCDYLASPKRIGIKKAYSYLKNNSASQLFRLWDRAPNDSKVPERPHDYERQFDIAKLVFRHQRVYDDEKQMLVNLTPIESNIVLDDELYEAIGPYIDPETAKGIARGFLHPVTHEPYAYSISIPAQIDINTAASIIPKQGKYIESSIVQGCTERSPLCPSGSIICLQTPSPPETEQHTPVREGSHIIKEVCNTKYSAMSCFTDLSKLRKGVMLQDNHEYPMNKSISLQKCTTAISRTRVRKRGKVKSSVDSSADSPASYTYVDSKSQLSLASNCSHASRRLFTEITQRAKFVSDHTSIKNMTNVTKLTDTKTLRKYTDPRKKMYQNEDSPVYIPHVSPPVFADNIESRVRITRSKATTNKLVLPNNAVPRNSPHTGPPHLCPDQKLISSFKVSALYLEEIL